MDRSNLDYELKKHLDEVISSRKISFDDTKQMAMNLWTLICEFQMQHKSKRVVVQHFPDGKVITTMYSEKVETFKVSKRLITYIDEKLVDYCADMELLQILCIVAENSNIQGKCRLHNNGVCNELQLDFKKKKS